MRAHLRLHYEWEKAPISSDMEGDRLIVGRDASADLAIPDITISRQHAQIVRTERGFCIQDLGSRNGTKVNGAAVQSAYLSNGDEVMLGSFRVFVEISTDRAQAAAGESSTASGSRVVLEDSQIHAEGTVVRSVADVKKFLAGEQHIKHDTRPSAIEEENRILMVLSQVGRALISVEPLQDTLDKVMDLVLKHIAADRGILMLMDEKTGELAPRVVRSMSGAAPEGEVRMSRTIANKVIREQVSILSSDVQTDSRFTGGESIRIMGILSAMCVPLWNQDKVIGLIQVDTQKKSTIYSDRDLDLLAALGNYAAVAIERARLHERVEHERALKSRLERYHSPQVAQRILASQSESGTLEAVEKNVTVMFVDMVGFTSMSEKLAPAEVAQVLNRVFDRFTDIIFRHEGTLDKYLGDAIMAVFGAPIDSQQHALQAVRAAFEMRAALDELNNDGGGQPLRFHFGINSGPVVAGDIGSPRRKEYTVLGNTVNTAARIQANSPADAIWVGPQTYDAVKKHVEAKKVGQEKFKGLAKSISIYELLSIRPLQDEDTHET